MSTARSHFQGPEKPGKPTACLQGTCGPSRQSWALVSSLKPTWMLHRDPVQALLGNIGHSHRNFYARQPPMGRWALIISFQGQTDLLTEGVIWLLCATRVCTLGCVSVHDELCGYVSACVGVPAMWKHTHSLRSQAPPPGFRPSGNDLLAFLFPGVSISEHNGQLFEYKMLCSFLLCFFSSFYKRGSNVSQVVMCLLGNIFIYCPESLPINNMTDKGFYAVRTFFLALWLKKGGKS